MEKLIEIYSTSNIIKYMQKCIDEVGTVITNTEKLEWRIHKQLISYLEIKKGDRISFSRIKHLINREIDQALRENRLQNTVLYSDLAITNGFGESLEYEPEDEVTNVGQDVLERTVESSLKGKIARLASDDFEEFVLQSWMLGDSDVEIARELALRKGGKVPSLVVKISRFRERCKKRWTKETFVS